MVANWAWFKPQYLPFASDLDQPVWIWVRYLLPMVVFLAPLVGLKQRRRTAFSSLALVGLFVFLAKGLKQPFSNVNLWLYLNAPMFWLFRGADEQARAGSGDAVRDPHRDLRRGHGDAAGRGGGGARNAGRKRWR